MPLRRGHPPRRSIHPPRRPFPPATRFALSNARFTLCDALRPPRCPLLSAPLDSPSLSYRDGLEGAGAGGVHESGAAVAVHVVQRRAQLLQEGHDVEVAGHGGVAHAGAPLGGFVPHAPPVLCEHHQRLLCARRARLDEGGLAVPVLAVDVRAVLHQQQHRLHLRAWYKKA
eukprot:1176807-Prorocentrum_minimum.AAC.1